MKWIALIFLFTFPGDAICQFEQSQFISEILTSNIIDTTYTFGKWDKNGGEAYHIKYLGRINLDNSLYYKVVNTTYIWGHSGRATHNIHIYDSNNLAIGNYNVWSKDHLPLEIESNLLVFTEVDCPSSIQTYVDFSCGLPSQLFLSCGNESGDLYNFRRIEK